MAASTPRASTVLCLACDSPNKPWMKKSTIPRRAVGPNDVSIAIQFCGICHSDLHQIKSDWGPSNYPIVPGHEIVGVVDRVGTQVSGFRVGDRVGVGCFTNSCRSCSQCKTGNDNYCSQWESTYNKKMPDGSVTYGGYSKGIVVDQNYVLRIPAGLDMAKAAPLLCAGITVYSPIMYYGIKPFMAVGVLGLGGLGHMAVKILHAIGCHIVVLSSSPSKQAEAMKLGANEFVVYSDPAALTAKASTLHAIIDTVSAAHQIAPFISLLQPSGKFILVGAPTQPFTLSSFDLIMRRITVCGSLIGSTLENQEMLDFCARHNLAADVEVVAAAQVNKALDRLDRNDFKNRFVIDLASLTEASPECESA